MPIVMTGTVSDVEERSFTKKDGSEGRSVDVYISSGRKTYKTIGLTNDGIERGDNVILAVEPRSWRNSDEVEMFRLGVILADRLLSHLGIKL